MAWSSEAEKRAGSERIIRDTIERRSHSSGLRSTEVDTAVKNGMAIMDSNRGLNWGQIADAAIAVTKEQHS
jgi:hypothetical protein